MGKRSRAWHDPKTGHVAKCGAALQFDVDGGKGEVGCSLWEGHDGLHRAYPNHDTRNPLLASWKDKDDHR